MIGCSIKTSATPFNYKLVSVVRFVISWSLTFCKLVWCKRRLLSSRLGRPWTSIWWCQDNIDNSCGITLFIKIIKSCLVVPCFSNLYSYSPGLSLWWVWIYWCNKTRSIISLLLLCIMCKFYKDLNNIYESIIPRNLTKKKLIVWAGFFK